MNFVAIVTLLFASQALAIQLPEGQTSGLGGWCATPEPKDEWRYQASTLRTMESQMRNPIISRNSADNDTFNETVDVYFHVVRESPDDSVITEQQLKDQFNVLKEAYSLHGFHFVLIETLYHDDEYLASSPTSFGKDVEKFEDFFASVRQGGYDTLNIYFYTAFEPINTYGFCTLPEPGFNSPSFKAPSDMDVDGCHINAGTLPHGALEDYNLGYTVVHEVGHWLGLLHTFDGYSCSGSGDFIDDTPREKTPTVGCPDRKDSCPNDDGDDPIHNYMDYSSDPWYVISKIIMF